MAQALQRVVTGSIKVVISASKGIAVQAKGRPADIVAYGAAAAVVFLSVGMAYAVGQGFAAMVEEDD